MPKRSKFGGAEGISYDEMVVLLGQAQFHSANAGSSGSGKLEAFLMLAVLMEGVLRRLALLHLKDDDQFAALRGKRRNRYGLDAAIDDLCLLRVISRDEFKALEKFKSDRNTCMHEILGMRSNSEVQEYAGKLFLKHQAIFEVMLDKLHQRM